MALKGTTYLFVKMPSKMMSVMVTEKMNFNAAEFLRKL